MGQINSNIFRLGVNQKWKTEFFEKKRHELPLYTFKDLEIKSYIERFLDIHGIILYDYKQHYSDSTLNLYISYFVTPGFLIQKENNNGKFILIDKLGNRKIIKTILDKTVPVLYTKEFNTISSDVCKDFYKIKRYLKLNNYDDYLKQFHSLKLQRNSNDSQIFKNLFSSNISGVFDRMFKALSLFTGNQFNIVVTFCCINKNLNFLKSTQKKNFILLRKFKNTPFLKDGIELLFHVVLNTNSANLLANFIAFQVKKVKRHKFLLSFLKQTLTVLLTSNFSKVKGIKIIVKGRLNGVPRAKHKIITIGDVPVQSISEIIDYSQTTSHNANGSYGIKVWVVEK